MTFIDLNCDMGEGMDNDAELMSCISSANIACGFHAGDENTMKKTVELALWHRVAIGAHPGFYDRENFGRRELNVSPDTVYEWMVSQISILKKITDAHQTRLHHVKPHGALYNMAAKNTALAQSIANAVKDTDENLVLYGLSGSYLISEAKLLGLKTCREVFADRTYQDDGSLTPRSLPGALIDEEQKCIDQVLQMIQQGTVMSVNKKEVAIIADTICLHGDGKHAVSFAKKIFESLKQHHIDIKAL